MSLLIIGISHKTAPVKVREKFSITRSHLNEFFTAWKASCVAPGAVILSTCNRMELYVDANDRDLDAEDKIRKFILDKYSVEENFIGRYFYTLRDADAVRHLFRVASGLDSQVLGETQVLAQVRNAWLMAKEIGMTNEHLDELFEAAQEVGSNVRRQTRISQGNISIGSVAIKMLEEAFADLKEMAVLIIGAGKIGALVSRYLREKEIRGIFVASRTYAKAASLAEVCGGRAIGFGALEEELRGVDIVISSTSSPHIILKSEMIARVMRERKDKPLLMMDLALPRDIDPETREISGITLYDLDDLKDVVEENYNRRVQESVLAERIVERETDKFFERDIISVK